MESTSKIGFGGSCHWCTEAIFQSLIGVTMVEQGWISSIIPNDSFSEAVIVHFDPDQIDLQTLIEIHLHTHSCTSRHAMRNKYRSAIYSYAKKQHSLAEKSIVHLQKQFDQPIITKALPFQAFKKNDEMYLNYYFKKPENPFCQTYINPKLNLLLNKFSKVVNEDKVVHLR